MSKLLFAIADENPEEIFEYFDDESLDDLAENVYIKPVNTNLEVGAEISLLIEAVEGNHFIGRFCHIAVDTSFFFQNFLTQKFEQHIRFSASRNSEEEITSDFVVLFHTSMITHETCI